MGCCCREIRDCRYDLDKLRNADISCRFIKQINSEVEQQLRVIASLCEDAFMASGMAEIKNAVCGTVEPFIEYIAENAKQISHDTRWIERDRDDFIEADHYYHEQDDDD